MLWIDAETGTLSRSYVNASGCTVYPGAVLSRVGTQLYSAEELPGVEPDETGWVVIERRPEEVFSREAITSFADKPVTLGHASSADEAEALAVGRVRQPRRQGDHLLGDLEVCDRRAVGLIRDGWKGLSCGYLADYIQLGVGRARQVGIRGDHVAVLSPDLRARCGDECRILDSMPRRFTMRPTRDQHGNEDYRLSLRNPNHSEMGDNPESPSGPRIIATLPYPSTCYSLIDEKGHGVLLYTPLASVVYPGEGNLTSDSFRRLAQQRVQREQAAGRAYAERVAAFWKAQRHA
jgi:hypothetical protein